MGGDGEDYDDNNNGAARLAEAAFAAAACLFFWAVIMCLDAHNPNAMLGPVPYRGVASGALAAGVIAAVASVAFGGWRAGAVDVILLLMTGLTGLTGFILYTTWKALGHDLPYSWSAVAALAGIAVVLADFGLWWLIGKIQPPAPAPADPRST